MMEKQLAGNILDDRRIKLLNYLLDKHQIPEYGSFNIKELIQQISSNEYQKIFEENPEFESLWKEVDMAESLTRFLLDNGLARKTGESLQLTVARGRDLRKQGSYGKLLEDERLIVNEARRVSELEIEADRTAHRQYKINLLIAIGTTVAAIYYALEILDSFFGFYPYRHH